MSKYTNELIDLLNEIKEQGAIKATRGGDTGIGKTLEDLLKKEEDNDWLPDFKDIEIKSQRQASQSMITLFTKSPTYPKGANTKLRNKYGYNNNNTLNNTLHVTVDAHSFTKNQYSGHSFKIKVDRANQFIVLIVKDDNNEEIVDRETIWSFEVLEQRLKSKLEYLCIVTADETKDSNKNSYFHYNKFHLVYDFKLTQFLKALEDGKLKIDIRIGAYSDGRTHDHGTGFRITAKDLEQYGTFVEI